MQNLSWGQLLQIYGGFWLVMFVSVLIVAASAGLGFHIPLGMVADVQLGSLLAIIIFFEAIFAVLLAIMILTGNIRAAAMWLLFMIAYAFVSFGPVLALQLCAWIGGVDLHAQSHVYAWFQSTSRSVLAPLGLFGKSFSWADQAAVWPYVDKIGALLSIGLALPQIFSVVRQFGQRPIRQQA